MNKIKDELFKELDQLVPKMSDNLRDYPITVKEKKSFFKSLQFKILAPVLSFIFLALLMLPIFIKDDVATSLEQVYLIEVNPSFLLVADEADNLTQLKSGNSDADEVLISIDVDSLLGQNIDTAIETLADELLQLGYFDESSNNIMKISSDNGKKEVVDKFNDYFCNKGYYIAVLSEEITLDKFNEKFESDIKDLKDLSKHIEKMNDYVFENIYDSDIDVQKEYIDVYLKDNLIEALNKQLENIDLVEEVLINIEDCYEEISDYDEIKFPSKDYWILKQMYFPQTEEIELLFSKMESYLDEYERITNNKINSYLELKLAIKNIENISKEEIEEFIVNIDTYIESDQYIIWINQIIDSTKTICGNNSNNLEMYKDIPQNNQDFVDKIKDIYKNNNENKKNDFKDKYEKDKDIISEDELKDFIHDIEDIYGSIEDFWESKGPR